MKENNTENSDSQASKKLEPSRINAETNAKTNRAAKTGAQSRKGKKWSLWQHWKRASRRTQVMWIAEGVAIFTGLAVLTTYIIGNIQTSLHTKMEQRHFAEEHKPLVIHPMPPDLQFIACSPRAGFQFGNITVHYKNTGNITAQDVAISLPLLKIIPEKPTHNPFWDDRLPISASDCDKFPNSDAASTVLPQRTQLEPGTEQSLEIRQGFTNIAPNIKKGNFVQGDFKGCIYYKDGSVPHVTCDLYQIRVSSMEDLDRKTGTQEILCDGVQRKASFAPYFMGHCQK